MVTVNQVKPVSVFLSMSTRQPWRPAAPLDLMTLSPSQQSPSTTTLPVVTGSPENHTSDRDRGPRSLACRPLPWQRVCLWAAAQRTTGRRRRYLTPQPWTTEGEGRTTKRAEGGEVMMEGGGDTGGGKMWAWDLATASMAPPMWGRAGAEATSSQPVREETRRCFSFLGQSLMVSACS